MLILLCAAHVVPDSDKPTLRQDAKRLFSNETAVGEEWNSAYDTRYNSTKEAGRHALRDATAFATVALPSHYSVIYSVLDHLKRRLVLDLTIFDLVQLMSSPMDTKATNPKVCPPDLPPLRKVLGVAEGLSRGGAGHCCSQY